MFYENWRHIYVKGIRFDLMDKLRNYIGIKSDRQLASLANTSRWQSHARGEEAHRRKVPLADLIQTANVLGVPVGLLIDTDTTPDILRILETYEPPAFPMKWSIHATLSGNFEQIHSNLDRLYNKIDEHKILSAFESDIDEIANLLVSVETQLIAFSFTGNVNRFINRDTRPYINFRPIFEALQNVESVLQITKQEDQNKTSKSEYWTAAWLSCVFSHTEEQFVQPILEDIVTFLNALFLSENHQTLTWNTKIYQNGFVRFLASWHRGLKVFQPDDVDWIKTRSEIQSLVREALASSVVKPIAPDNWKP